MVNNDINCNSLLTEVREKYTNWRLFELNAKKILEDYISKHLCYDNISTNIYKLQFPDGEVKLELISNNLIDEDKLRDFCDCFNVRCKDVFLRTSFNDYSTLKSRTTLGQGNVIYAFIRKDCEVYYLNESHFDIY